METEGETRTEDEQHVTTGEAQEPETHDGPDEEAGPHVAPAEPIVGSQGSQGEQAPQPVTPGGFDPNVPVRTSGPTAEEQSGVPNVIGGDNEGVEAQEEYRGPVEPAPGESPEDDEA